MARASERSPAVHWFIERVHSPATGMGSTFDTPVCVAPVVRSAGLALVAEPDRRKLVACWSVIQSEDVRQVSGPWSK